MRIGSVTGPKPILDRIGLHMQASVMHASALSQVRALDITAINRGQIVPNLRPDRIKVPLCL